MRRHHHALQAVIFDMDGLMLDTERIAWIAWQRAASDWGFTLSKETFTALIGLTVPDSNAVLQEAFGPEFPVKEARRRRQHYYEAHIQAHGIDLKPGLLTLLARLERRHLPKAVASSTAREGVIHKLRVTGLTGRFEALVGGDEVKRGKPSPDIFLAAADRLGIAPPHCMVLEDSEPGIQAAHAAGMRPVMVPDFKEPSPETASLAHAVLPSLRDVVPLLDALTQF
jgi:HAD superfamily hydrolase (TIGR01509 family)